MAVRTLQEVNETCKVQDCSTIVNFWPRNKKKLKRGYLSIFNTSTKLNLTHTHLF